VQPALLITIGARLTALACKLLTIHAARLFHMLLLAHKPQPTIQLAAIVLILDISGARLPLLA
jgi:hypothetical protein